MALKIIFMGTPEFSIPALKALKQSKHKIVCVYTQPPKKKSRGQKILKTAVHVFSENEGIKVKTNKLSDENEYKNFINSDFTSITCLPILLLSASGTFDTVKIYLIDARAPLALPRCSRAFSLL